MEVEKFVSRVNTVLGLHQGRYIEGLVIKFEGMHEDQYDTRWGISPAIDSWVYSAVQKEVERFELRLSDNHAYKFPSIEMLRSHSYGGSCCSPFRRARVLKLRDVRIKDETVHYLLASCPNLEELYIWYSDRIKNLRVVDPPSLRVFELRTRCFTRAVKSVEISAESIVSLALIGNGNTSLLLDRVPNLRELTIGNDYFLDFISQPDSSFSDQLVKLVVVIDKQAACEKPLASLPDSLPQFFSLKRLEVRAVSFVGRSLLFFISLIKASPQLCEFRIEMSYCATFWLPVQPNIPYPAIRAEEAAKFDHTSLKVVEMCGYAGFSCEDELLVELLNNCASSIERVVIDTESDYYDSPGLANSLYYRAGIIGQDYLPELGAVTRSESKERAQHFVSSTIFPYPFPFSHQIEFIVM